MKDQDFTFPDRSKGEISTLTEFFGPVISSYTRAQAIQDGYLHDITDIAKQCGLKFPTAISNNIAAIIEKATENKMHDYKGIVFDIVNMLVFAIRLTPNPGDQINFTVKINGRNYQMYSKIGPGDTMDPVITIMLRTED